MQRGVTLDRGDLQDHGEDGDRLRAGESDGVAGPLEVVEARRRIVVGLEAQVGFEHPHDREQRARGAIG